MTPPSQYPFRPRWKRTLGRGARKDGTIIGQSSRPRPRGGNGTNSLAKRGNWPPPSYPRASLSAAAPEASGRAGHVPLTLGRGERLRCPDGAQPETPACCFRRAAACWFATVALAALTASRVRWRSPNCALGTTDGGQLTTCGSRLCASPTDGRRGPDALRRQARCRPLTVPTRPREPMASLSAWRAS